MSYAPSSPTTSESLTVNDSEVFQVVMLNSDTFVIPSRGRKSTSSGRVNCSIPFTSPDGRACLAFGCAEGLWIGYCDDSQSLRRVLYLKKVTQCAVLEEVGIFLVLANKMLLAYDIESLMPSSLQTENAYHGPQKLNGSTDVEFLSIGSLGGRTFVIYMIKKGSDNVFRVLEPTFSKVNGGRLDSQLTLQPSLQRCFRIHKNFSLSKEAHNVAFLKARIAVLCRKGFEIMDLTNYKSVTFPRLHDPCYKKLAKRCRSCRPMGMFHSGMKDFLLCYDKFGLYVNTVGDPIPTKDTIEWEGTAEHVACHRPYVFIFNSRFIEVRRIDTGWLCQIIRGNDLRCIWNGYGSTTLSPEDPDGIWGGWGDAPLPRPPVYGAMRADDVGGAVVQRVFEIVPTAYHLSPKSSCYQRKTDHPCTKFGWSESTLNPEYDLKKADRTSPMLCKRIRFVVRWMSSLFSGRNRRSASKRTTTSSANSSSQYVGHDKTPSTYHGTPKVLALPLTHTQLFKI